MTIQSSVKSNSSSKSKIKTLLTAQATALLTGLVLLCSAAIPVLANNLSVQLESIPMGKATFYMVTFEREMPTEHALASEATNRSKVTF
jgi:hypothetical protein